MSGDKSGIGELTAGDARAGKPGARGELHFLWIFGFPAVAILSVLLAMTADAYTDSKPLAFACYAFAVSAALIFCMTWRPGGGRVTITAALAAGLLFALSGFLAVDGYGWKSPSDPGPVLPVFGQPLFVIFALLPLLQARLETGSWSWRREPFRTHAWDNGFILSFALFCAVVAFVAVMLLSHFSRTLGSDIADEALSISGAVFIPLSAAVGVGIGLARVERRLLPALQRIALNIATFIAPFLLLFAIGLLALLLVMGVEALAEKINLTRTLLTVGAIGLIVTGTLVYAGSGTRAGSRFLRYSVFALQPILVCLLGFACYALYLRIAQYGLTPKRIVVCFAALFFLLLCIGGLVSLVFRDRWAEVGRRARGIAGLIAAAAVILTMTPLADIFTLSAHSQYRRLADGQADPETFNYHYLAFKLGDAGRQALGDLREDSGRASATIVNRKLDELQRGYPLDDDRDDEFASREVPDRDGMRDPSRIILIPPDLELPDVFFRGRFVNAFVSTASCRLDDGPGCLIAAAEITDGDGDEYLLAVRRPGAGTEVWLMEHHGARWQSTKLLHPIGIPELWETLVQGDMATIPASHHDLRIGERVIRLRDLYP